MYSEQAIHSIRLDI